MLFKVDTLASLKDAQNKWQLKRNGSVDQLLQGLLQPAGSRRSAEEVSKLLQQSEALEPIVNREALARESAKMRQVLCMSDKRNKRHKKYKATFSRLSSVRTSPNDSIVLAS